MARSVTTFLMFEGAAEEAMNLYVSLFPDSHLGEITRHGPEAGAAAGTVYKAELTLAGHRLRCFDSPGKHAFTFTPAISLFVDCADAAEFEQAFQRLSDGGSLLMPPDDYGFSTRFAWLSDRWGVSWQLNLP